MNEQIEILEAEWKIELNPSPPDKKPFLCRIWVHSWTQFTHMGVRQEVYKCLRCGDESGRKRI